MRFTMKDASNSLCHSCQESHILLNSRGKQTIRCLYSSRSINIVTDVMHCNVYARIGAMDKYEANKIGWVLERKGERIGFAKPKRDDE